MVRGSSSGGSRGTGGRGFTSSRRSIKVKGKFRKVSGGQTAQFGPGTRNSRIDQSEGFNDLTDVEKTLFKRKIRGLSDDEVGKELENLKRPKENFRRLQPGDDIGRGGSSISRFDTTGEKFEEGRDRTAQEAINSSNEPSEAAIELVIFCIATFSL